MHLLITLLILTLTACSVGPNYVRPLDVVPVKYKEAQSQKIPKAKGAWKVAEPKDDCHRGAWWEIFQDAKLNELEKQLNAYDPTIINAAENYLQAQALVDEARANFFPTFNIFSTVDRQKTNSSVLTAGVATPGIPGTTGTPTTGATIASTASTSTARFNTTHSLLLQATWEPDIWGLVRRQVEASAAGAQASAALYAATRLSEQALVAQYYFQLRAVDMDQKILNDTITAYQKTLTITKNRYTQGVAGMADVVQAQTQVETAQALAINNGINRAIYEHAIAILIGLPPGNFTIPFMPLIKVPPTIPIEVPAKLLERRPDVAQAERLMAQANADIGVAYAAYFPNITLTGSVSSFGKALAHFFAFKFWDLNAQLAETVLNGGLREATVRAAKAGYEAAVANYKHSLLVAFQNVEDNLATLRILNDQAIRQNQAYHSAIKALQIVLNEYKAGTVDFTSVVVAQTTAYTAEKNAADITGLRAVAAVNLIKALGGGWDVSAIANAAN